MSQAVTMNHILVFLFAYLFVVQADVFGDWEQYKTKYGKSYRPEEDDFRRSLFIKSLKNIQDQNKNLQARRNSFQTSLNAFADITDEEYKKLSASGVPMTSEEWDMLPSSGLLLSEPPSSVNWVEYGFNTTVMNQGTCGCCYAMATTASIEGHYYIKHKIDIGLSQQEIIDCSQSYGNKGCQYGYIPSTIKYIKSKGVGTAEKNPYTGHETQCLQTEPRYFINKWFKSARNDEKALMEAVAKGPVLVLISAELESFKFYKSGVYDDPKCKLNIFGINHFVTIVGYGNNENAQSYWLIKNSWGSHWGVEGYMYMARNANNMCGIGYQPVYPDVF